MVDALKHGRPKAGYFLDATKASKVPSVTTIISRFKESGGLIHWAWKMGMEGKDYREERDAAASAGSLAHMMVEEWIRKEGERFTVAHPDPEVLKRANSSFDAFLEWANQSELRIVQHEVPLVSKKHKFGGTFDAILIKGKRAMGDWKTSNNVYGDYLLQLAAYKILWEENYPDQPIDGGFHLVRFDKEYGDFHHHWWGELEAAERGFLLMRELYPIMDVLKKRAS